MIKYFKNLWLAVKGHQSLHIKNKTLIIPSDLTIIVDGDFKIYSKKDIIINSNTDNNGSIWLNPIFDENGRPIRLDSPKVIEGDNNACEHGSPE
mgnify:CR=1 FL=1